MKKIFLLFVVLSFTFSIAQTNQTPTNRYSWNKKGTEPALGYVVLKSGTKMEGMIQLKGKPDDIKNIILVKNEKEIEFEPASLSSYGLNVSELVNDSPEEMYEWKAGMTSTSMGKTTVKSFTKTRRGYVILNNGKRIDGELHLNKVNDVLDEIVIKNEAEGKQVLNPAEVSHYGLVPTIADITKGGKKVFDDEGKNFKKGYYTKTDGTKVNGMLAFMKANDIPNSDAIKYELLFYSPSEDEALVIIETAIIKEVVQMKGGDTTILYVPYSGGFVEQSKVSSLSISDQYKLYQPGKIILADKTELSGQVAQVFAAGKDYGIKLNFKTASDSVVSYNPEQILSFEQTIKQVAHKFVPLDARFVKLIFDGKVFTYFRNPSPTTINERATKMAKTGASLMGSLASNASINSMKDLSDEDKKKAKESIGNASAEELKANREAIDKAEKAGLKDENLSKAKTALAAQEIGKTVAQGIVVYNIEYFIWNKKSGEKKLIIKNDFSDNITPVLQSCEEYLMMSKPEQKKYTQIENVELSLKMLDDCYSKGK